MLELIVVRGLLMVDWIGGDDYVMMRVDVGRDGGLLKVV
jgi:hypothetical protein